MRLLAEFIMRGRLQAICIALGLYWFPVVPQGAVGLVTLRKGWQEGFLVMLAALLPSAIAIVINDKGVAAASVTAVAVIITWCLGAVLRLTISWATTLAMLLVLSIFGASLVWLLSPNLAEEFSVLTERLSALFSAAPQEPSSDGSVVDGQDEVLFPEFTAMMATGAVAFSIALNALTGLFFGRWLQAKLYNPGGFRSEFHQLRLHSSLALVCAGVLALCGIIGNEFIYWMGVFSLPLFVAGLGLAHYFIATIGGGIAAVVALYLALLLISPLVVVVALFGLTDTWLNYRARFKFKQ